MKGPLFVSRSAINFARKCTSNAIATLLSSMLMNYYRGHGSSAGDDVYSVNNNTFIRVYGA